MIIMKNLKLKSACLALCVGLGISAGASAYVIDCPTAAYLCEFEHDFNACLWQFENCNT